MFEPISFSVEGKAVPQGSKNPMVPQYKDGSPVRRHRKTCPAFGDRTLAREGSPGQDGQWKKFSCKCPIMVNVIEDDGGRLAPWREAIGWHARMAYKGELIQGAVVLAMEFVKPRPKNHYGTGKNAEVLKDSAPAAPIIQPDVLKLARAAEDALTNVLYVDDSQVVTELISKRYCHHWEPEHVNITLRLLEVQTVGDLVAAGRIEPMRADEQFDQLSLAV